jgi:integrase
VGRSKKEKGPREPHEVPLSNTAISILQKLREFRRNDFIFPGRDGPHCAHNLMLRLLKRMPGRKHLTTHGFRSTFQDWAEDCTDFSETLVEMALAHKIKNKVRRAYRRKTALAKRRRLMQAWDDFCNRPEFYSEYEEAAE